VAGFLADEVLVKLGIDPKGFDKGLTQATSRLQSF
jgi:hypothetical protein